MMYQFIGGSYTRVNSKGIYGLKINLQEQTSQHTLLDEISRPTYVVVKDRQLFSSAEIDHTAGVMIYQLDDQGQATRKQFLQMGEKSSPAHVTVSHNGQWIVSSNYHEGCFVIYQKEGEKYQPYRKVVESQSGSHVHQAIFCDQDEWLYVVDLGIDRIKIYDVTKDFEFVYELVLPPGFGPRHIVLIDEYLYCLGEYSHQVAVFKQHQDHGELIQLVDTVDQTEANSTSAAIRLTRNQKYLYTSIRGQDQITAFRVNDQHHLEKIEERAVRGKHPRDLIITHDDQYVLVANKDSDNITVFKIDLETGQLDFVMEAACEEGVSLAEII